MPKVVSEIPKGLREDHSMEDGFYVGSKHSHLNYECFLTLEDAKGIDIGICQKKDSEQKRVSSVFIDDEKSEVYVPIGKDIYKFDPEDGMVNTNPPLQPFSARWKNRLELFGSRGMAFRYAILGLGGLAVENLKESLENYGGCRTRLGIHAYILENREKREDIKKDPSLILGAADCWLEKGESKYFDTSFDVIKKFIKHGDDSSHLEAVLDNDDSVRKYLLGVMAERLSEPQPSPEWSFVLAKASYSNTNLMDPLFWRASQVLWELAKDPKPRSSANYEAASFLVDNEGNTNREMALEALLQLAENDAYPPTYRLGAAKSAWASSRLPEMPEQEKRAIESLKSLMKAPTPAGIRYKAAEFVSYKEVSEEDYKYVLESFLELAKDSKVASAEIRWRAFKEYSGSVSEKKPEVIDLALQLSQELDTSLPPGGKFYLLRFVYENVKSKEVREKTMEGILKIAETSVTNEETRHDTISSSLDPVFFVLKRSSESAQRNRALNSLYSVLKKKTEYAPFERREGYTTLLLHSPNGDIKKEAASWIASQIETDYNGNEYSNAVKITLDTLSRNTFSVGEKIYLTGLIRGRCKSKRVNETIDQFIARQKDVQKETEKESRLFVNVEQ